jgi:FMN reductase
MNSIHVVGFGGSLDSDSACLTALQVALSGAREAGARTELLSLRELDLPLYVHGMAPPPGALRLAEATARAHGLLWSSPLYHGTISGAFKNALDWLELLSKRDPPYLTDKVVGLIATAGGVQGLQAVNTMEYVVRSLRGFTHPFTVPIARAGSAFGADGMPTDPGLTAQLQRLGSEVVRTASLLAAQEAPARTQAT